MSFRPPGPRQYERTRGRRPWAVRPEWTSTATSRASRWSRTASSRRPGRSAAALRELPACAETLRKDEEVALEATGNTEAIALLPRPKVARVVVSNPHKIRAIGEAKVKTDKADARILAQLLAADSLPPVWLPDEHASRKRRLIARRMYVVRQRTITNQVQSILHQNLMPRPPVSDAFDTRGRAWLQRLPLSDNAREAVDALLR